MNHGCVEAGSGESDRYTNPTLEIELNLTYLERATRLPKTLFELYQSQIVDSKRPVSVRTGPLTI